MKKEFKAEIKKITRSPQTKEGEQNVQLIVKVLKGSVADIPVGKVLLTIEPDNFI
jgi:hypothetical protein